MCVRGRVLGVVGKRVYFQTSGKRSGGFWPIRSYILTSGVGNGWPSGSKTFITIIKLSYRYFCRFIYFLSGFQSEFCFRIDIHTSTFPCVWPRNHGGGRFYTRTGHNGRRISFPGRWDEPQLARQIRATHVMVGIGFHVNYQQIHQTSTYWLRENRRDYSKELTFHNYDKLN